MSVTQTRLCHPYRQCANTASANNEIQVSALPGIGSIPEQCAAAQPWASQLLPSQGPAPAWDWPTNCAGPTSPPASPAPNSTYNYIQEVASISGWVCYVSKSAKLKHVLNPLLHCTVCCTPVNDNDCSQQYAIELALIAADIAGI